MARVPFLCVCLLLAAQQSLRAEPPRLLQVELPSGILQGMPVHWGDSDAALLDRAGAFHWFEVSQVRQHRLLKEAYIPQSLTEARSHLQAELGSSFETLIAGPYVIAAPSGEASRWQTRFLSLLSGYTRYFQVRGWSLRQPDFPLVVIVFGSQQQFRQYAAEHHGPLPAQAVGSYFPQSNRCILYQIPGYRGVDWSETEATIVHEAVHQLAYNTAIHERLFENPLWFVEGLATMFEQPAVYELGVDRSTVAARVHPEKLQTIRPLLQDTARLSSELRDLIESDELFETDPRRAYALGWALTFFLSERMPSQYQTLVDFQRQRGTGGYSSHQRLSDFETACQLQCDLLAVQLTRFFESTR